MSKIYKFELVINTGEEIKDISSKNFSIYRGKYSYSPIYLISNDKEVFEIGYFDDDSMAYTYKESNVSENDILTNKDNEYVKIENVENIPDFLIGIYALIKDMYSLKSSEK